MIIDTFSANSLKILENSKDEFMNKFVYKLDLYKRDLNANLGQKFHSLLCAYIKGFDIDKMAMELNEKEREIFSKVIEKLAFFKDDFILCEYSFNIKEKLNDKYYFLTGRFDAVLKKDDTFIIYDWKTLNIPKDYQTNLQTIIYLYALNKIYKTEKITMRYLSLTKLEEREAVFESSKIYKDRIDKIVSKIYN